MNLTVENLEPHNKIAPNKLKGFHNWIKGQILNLNENCNSSVPLIILQVFNSHMGLESRAVF
jgi:hypothetical protein